MRVFTLVASLVFIVCGVWMITSGDRSGWLVGGFFLFCFLIAVFEDKLPKPWLAGPYRLLITSDAVACEHPRRKRESIRWDDVIRVWFVTTPAGPYMPDHWMLLEGESGGCSFPMEALGIDGIWDELKQRFAGFDYGPVIQGGTEYAKHLCWERQRLTG